MKIRLPERVAGVREAMFVVEAEFPVSSSRRQIEVKTTGPIQAMDVRGEGPGGSYELPVGGERLHVPVRVTHGGAGEATIEVACVDGPESGQSEARTVLLDPSMVVGSPQAVASSAGGGGKWLATGLLVAALAGGGYMAKDKIASFFGGGPSVVPEIQGWSHETAEKTLKDRGFASRIMHKQVDDADDDGRVLSVSPSPGTELESGGIVTMTIGVPKSKGTPVPVLRGMTEANAQATLDDLGLRATIEYEPVDDAALQGHVLSQKPAKGELITRGETVVLRIGGESKTIADATPALPDPSDPSASSPDSSDPGEGTEPTERRPVIADEPESSTGTMPPGETPGESTTEAPSDPGDATAELPEEGDSKMENGSLGNRDNESPPGSGHPDSASAETPNENDPAKGEPNEEGPNEDKPATGEGATTTTKDPAVPNATDPASSNAPEDGAPEDGAPEDGAPESNDPEVRDPNVADTPDENPTIPDQPMDDGLVSIPVVVGKPLAEARAAIDKLGLYVLVEKRTVTKESLVGTVLQSIPAATERVSPAGMVQLTVGASAKAASPDTPANDTPRDPAPKHPDPADPAKEDLKPANPNAEDPKADGLAPKDPKADASSGDQPVDPNAPTPENNDPEAKDPAASDPTRSDPAGESIAPQPGRVEPPAAITTEVPDVVGMDRERAESLVRRAKLYYDLKFEDTENLPSGQVISQDPPAGSTLESGKVVRLTVARLPRSFSGTLPDVIGLERNDAESRLRRRKVQVRVTYGGGTPSQAGMVLDMAPAAGEEVNEGAWVELVIATGKGGETPKAVGGPSPWSQPEPTPVESAQRRPPGQPRGLLVEPPPMKRGAAPAKRVQLPARDSEPTATVPNVKGQSVYAAIERALAAGLLPIVTPNATGQAKIGHVVEQGTEAAKKVHLGDLLKLAVFQPKPGPSQRTVNIPSTVGGSAFRAHRRLQQSGITVRIVEVAIPEHPYAGTRRVAAQYPVSAVSAVGAPQVTLWVIK